MATITDMSSRHKVGFGAASSLHQSIKGGIIVFYSISFPLIDKRVFLAENTYRIDMSEFPRNWNDSSFLRSFGMFGQRRNPTGDILYQEKKYAKANRGVRIADQNLILRYKRVRMKPDCVFRRVFFDDYSARFDIGLKQTEWRLTALTIRDIMDRIETVLKYTVQVNDDTEQQIVNIGKELASKFLYATTKEPGKKWEMVNPYWIVSACPSIIIEAEHSQMSREWFGEKKCIFHAVQIPEQWGLYLFHYVHRNGMPVWIIVKNDDFQKDKLRALRIYLLKLHQEREALKVFRNLVAAHGNSKGILDLLEIEKYLKIVTSTFSRKKRDGVEQQPIIDAVRNADIVAYGVESQMLLEYLEQHLSYLKKRCEKVMEKTINFNGPFTGNFVAGDNAGKLNFEDKSQTASSNIDHQLVEMLLEELRQHIPLESSEKDTFEECAKKIAEESGKQEPDKGFLTQMTNVLKTIKPLAKCGAALVALAKALGLLTLV